MLLKDWIEKRKEEQIASRSGDVKIDDSVSNLWVKCYNCSEQIPRKEIEANMMVCPRCDYHFRIGARERIFQLCDEDTFEELFSGMKACDPLEFSDLEPYKDRLEKANEKTGLDEAVIVGVCKIEGQDTCLAVMDFDYMGGSMGSVVGEKVASIMEEAIKRQIPMVAVTASGGARMQESVLSLMQMAKTSCAVAKMNEAGILYISVLTEPTFGGVTASFGTIGDVIIAEQGARIGFAGRRVIEQTIYQKLPSDFQTAEYLMKYGQIDVISNRKDLKSNIGKILKIHANLKQNKNQGK